MFIKKDLRKIPEILVDENDERVTLKLFKRSAEFLGNLSIFAFDVSMTPYQNLRVLNLYDNHLTSLEGIGNLDQTPIEEINLGCNDLDQLPAEFGRLTTLTTLWLDDNNFEYFPTCICLLKKLKVLRFSSNKLTLENLPSSISQLTALETLALDNNSITTIPEVIWTLTSLQYLWMRQNPITHLTSGLFCLLNLQTLSLSSCQLRFLPQNNSLINSTTSFLSSSSSTLLENETQLETTQLDQDEDEDMEYEYEGDESITKKGIRNYEKEFGLRNWSSFVKLKNVYLNGNHLTFLPETFPQMPSLENLNIANNSLEYLPSPWDQFSSAEVVNGVITIANESTEVTAGSHQLKITILGNTKLR